MTSPAPGVARLTGREDKLLVAWDAVDSAINRVLTAQPFQMTAASERLEVARLNP